MPDDTTREFVQNMLGTISEHCNMMMKELTFMSLIERIDRKRVKKRPTATPQAGGQRRGRL